LSRPKFHAAALALSIAGFIALGVLFAPLAGIQTDEALFASPFYAGFPDPYRLTIFGFHLPLMVFPYIGALKTILYWPILKLFSPNAFVLRVPAILLGGLTILLFYQVVQKVAGSSAALIASLLLACDPSFLLMNTFDWGPVAIEHLLLMLAAWFYVRGKLSWACFVLGLGLWNKAVFVWAFTGILAGAAVVWALWIRRVSAADVPLLAKAPTSSPISRAKIPIRSHDLSKPSRHPCEIWWASVAPASSHTRFSPLSSPFPCGGDLRSGAPSYSQSCSWP
jgi:4-amino-4-deoxy-L-arabinose transferase-like glycosyltransferase